MDDNVDDDKESKPEADGDADGVVDLSGADSDSDDVNHKNLKLSEVGSDGKEEGEGSLSVDKSMDEESV